MISGAETHLRDEEAVATMGHGFLLGWVPKRGRARRDRGRGGRDESA